MKYHRFIDHEDFDEKTGEYEETRMLKTVGCGCCCDYVEITKESLNEAIEEAEDWLSQLRIALIFLG